MHPRYLAVLLVATFAAALVLSAVDGAPSELPGVAMRSPVLLHVMRAAVGSALLVAAAVVVLYLWRGRATNETLDLGIGMGGAVERSGSGRTRTTTPG